MVNRTLLFVNGIMTVPHSISYNIKNTCLWIDLAIELDLVETARIKVIRERLRAGEAGR